MTTAVVPMLVRILYHYMYTTDPEVSQVKWDMDGVSVYFFPRGSEPADITSKVPQPDTWGVPQAVWSAATCDPFKYFSNQQLIIDTVLW